MILMTAYGDVLDIEAPLVVRDGRGVLVWKPARQEVVVQRQQCRAVGRCVAHNLQSALILENVRLAGIGRAICLTCGNKRCKFEASNRTNRVLELQTFTWLALRSFLPTGERRSYFTLIPSLFVHSRCVWLVQLPFSNVDWTASDSPNLHLRAPPAGPSEDGTDGRRLPCPTTTTPNHSRHGRTKSVQRLRPSQWISKQAPLIGLAPELH